MITITTSAAMADYLVTLTDATLKRILTDRVEQLSEYDGYDLGELARFLIVQPGDTLDAIEAVLGFSPLACLAESVTAHGGWYEAVFLVSDDGFGWVVLVPDNLVMPQELLVRFRGASELRQSR